MLDCLGRDKYGGPTNFFKVIPILIEKFRMMLKNTAPCLHQLIFAEYPECFWPRRIVGFLFGASVGLVFYDLILADLAFGRGTVYFLGILFTVLLAVGCAASSQVRCITLITIPSFSGKAGRNLIQAVILGIIVTDPLANIGRNIEEIMRMYTCSNAMAYNITQAKYDLLVKPFKMAFLNTKVNTEELKDMLGSVNNVVEPFQQEIEGIDDIKFIKEENDYMDEKLNDTKRSEEIDHKYRSPMKKFKRSDEQSTDPFGSIGSNNTNFAGNETAYEYQQKYLKKLEIRCESVKTGMSEMCKKRFDKFSQQCEDAIHWSISWAICWPMKLDIICDIVKMFTYGGYDCDPSSDVSGRIGEGYVKLKNAGQVMKEGIANERTQYKLEKPPNFVGVYSMYTITKEFAHEILTKKSFGEALIAVIKTVLAFVFLLVIRSASNYHYNFVKYTDFDNFYVTADFRTLDARRRKLGLPTLLPQTKAERLRTADPYSFWLGVRERKNWENESFLIFVFIGSCSVVVVMDIILAGALAWIRNNLEFSYIERGTHALRIEVEGIGFVASIIRSIVKGFDFKKDLKGEVSNRECLPHETYITPGAYLKIYGSSFLLIILSFAEGYIKRLRRAICAFYYREKEKIRIESMYKGILLFRQRLLKRRMQDLLEKAKGVTPQVEGRLLYYIIQHFPFLSFLEFLPDSSPICVICVEEKPFFSFWGGRHKYVKCEKCKNYYCAECWTNFYYTCFVCTSNEVFLGRPFDIRDAQEQA